MTLGPAGTCHERTAIQYMAFEEGEDFGIEMIGDFFDGVETIRGRDKAFLIQCSAHPKVHQVTERYWPKVFVADTFIHPTMALAVLTLVPATSGRLDLSEWKKAIDVQSKPIVAEELLAGRYEPGSTYLEHAVLHPEELLGNLEIGEIDTTWAYGARKRFQGEVIGIPLSKLFYGSGLTAAA